MNTCELCGEDYTEQVCGCTMEPPRRIISYYLVPSARDRRLERVLLPPQPGMVIKHHPKDAKGQLLDANFDFAFDFEHLTPLEFVPGNYKATFDCVVRPAAALIAEQQRVMDLTQNMFSLHDETVVLVQPDYAQAEMRAYAQLHRQVAESFDYFQDRMMASLKVPREMLDGKVSNVSSAAPNLQNWPRPTWRKGDFAVANANGDLFPVRTFPGGPTFPPRNSDFSAGVAPMGVAFDQQVLARERWREPTLSSDLDRYSLAAILRLAGYDVPRLGPCELVPGDEIEPGDEWRSADGWRPVTCAVGMKVAKPDHMRRPSVPKKWHELPADPYQRARIAQVELGLDRDVAPPKTPTPPEFRIQDQHEEADGL